MSRTRRSRCADGTAHNLAPQAERHTATSLLPASRTVSYVALPMPFASQGLFPGSQLHRRGRAVASGRPSAARHSLPASQSSQCAPT